MGDGEVLDGWVDGNVDMEEVRPRASPVPDLGAANHRCTGCGFSVGRGVVSCPPRPQESFGEPMVSGVVAGSMQRGKAQSDVRRDPSKERDPATTSCTASDNSEISPFKTCMVGQRIAHGLKERAGIVCIARRSAVVVP